MELFAQIRRDARVDGLGIRELARKYQVGRTTVRLALESAVPPEKKPRVRTAPRLEGWRVALDGTPSPGRWYPSFWVVGTETGSAVF